MRILQYCPFDIKASGGVERHIAFLSEGLRRLGCEVEIGTSVSETFFECKTKLILHSHGDRLPPFSLIKSFGHERWVHTFHGTSIGRAMACREFFGLRNYLSGAKESIAAHSSHGVICVSSEVKKQIKLYYLSPMRKNQKIRVISNGAPKLDNGGDSAIDRVAGAGPYILYLGRGADRVKNCGLLKDAFSKVCSENSEIQLKVAPGEGFQASNRIEILGQQNTGQMTKLLESATALILCSFYEGDSLVLWEAMALGTPIIATKEAASKLREWSYKPYQYVSRSNPFELASAIQKFHSSPPERTPIIRTWEDVAKETLEFYRLLT